MSTNLPMQKLARPVSAFPAFTRSVRPRVLLPLQQRQQQQQTQRRTIFGFWNRKRDTTVLDPMSERFTQRKQKQDGLGSAVPERGSTGTGSILDATDTAEEAADAKSSRREQKADVGGSGAGVSLSERDPKLMAPALDPNPKARRAWERKMLIRELRRRGRIGKKTLLARTEREYLSKSPLIKTSIKKLMMLARQISGKPLDEAMVQMRFSKKKAAADILRHLERARDEAIVSRGMGLGAANAAAAVAEATEDGVPAPTQPTRMVVQDKKGVRRAVMDKTAMYIDQAWVGRGTPDYGVDYRARGRAYRLVKPWTSITVVLKEEQTRIRQMNEREDKAAAKMPWLHLPDRPVTRQHQYPLW